MNELQAIHESLCIWLDERNDEYRSGDPTVTDHQWEVAFQALVALVKAEPKFITADSPTQNVG